MPWRICDEVATGTDRHDICFSNSFSRTWRDRPHIGAEVDLSRGFLSGMADLQSRIAEVRVTGLAEELRLANGER
jgi:hypothetical protein